MLDLGAMANPMFKMKGPNMINDSFAPHFPLKHAQKDMKYVKLPTQILLITVNNVLSYLYIFHVVDIVFYVVQTFPLFFSDPQLLLSPSFDDHSQTGP